MNRPRVTSYRDPHGQTWWQWTCPTCRPQPIAGWTTQAQAMTQAHAHTHTPQHRRAQLRLA